MKHALWIYLPALAFCIALAAPAQTISQDYARYSGMLNQERSDSIKRDGQAIIDAGSPRNAGSGGGSTGGVGSSSSSGGSAVAPSIGMLVGTINDIQARHAAAEVARQKRNNDARNRYDQQNRDNAKASDDFLAAYAKAHPTPEQAKANAVAEAAEYTYQGYQALKGIGAKADPSRAISLLSQAYRLGDLNATRLLAVSYYNGSDGIPKNYDRAFPYYVTLASYRELKAMVTTCTMVVHGWGTTASVAAAEQYCLPAIAKGDASAADSMGFLYARALPAAQANRVKATEYYQKAFDGGSTEGVGFLTAMYRGGDQKPADNAAIIALLEPLVTQGDPNAEIEMGLLYFDGAGVKIDHAKTAALYQKAADQASARAMDLLSRLIAAGDGLPKDPEKSLKLLRQAAVQGWPPALFDMGMRTRKGDGVPRDVPEGIKLLSISVDKGQIAALVELEQIYTLGLGVPKDPVEAKHWRYLCAAFGNQGCIDREKTN
jgi:TPR repeat protein